MTLCEDLERALNQTTNTMDRQEILKAIHRGDCDYWMNNHPELLIRELRIAHEEWISH